MVETEIMIAKHAFKNGDFIEMNFEAAGRYLHRYTKNSKFWVFCISYFEKCSNGYYRCHSEYHADQNAAWAAYEKRRDSENPFLPSVGLISSFGAPVGSLEYAVMQFNTKQAEMTA